jgi:hypothetical protein
VEIFVVSKYRVLQVKCDFSLLVEFYLPALEVHLEDIRDHVQIVEIADKGADQVHSPIHHYQVQSSFGCPCLGAKMV